jgi:hypothetical protein
MMSLLEYNQLFKDYYFQFLQPYNDAEHLGVRIEPPTYEMHEGDPYWRVEGVHLLTPNENVGKHHIFVDVLRNGSRVKGAKVQIEKIGGSTEFVVVDKPDNEPGTNVPLYSKDVATISVANSAPGERITGLRTTHPDSSPGNTWGHYSFYAVFQLAHWSVSQPEHEEQPAPAPGELFKNLELDIIGTITVRIKGA